MPFRWEFSDADELALDEDGGLIAPAVRNMSSVNIRAASRAGVPINCEGEIPKDMVCGGEVRKPLSDDSSSEVILLSLIAVNAGRGSDVTDVDIEGIECCREPAC